MDSHDYQRVELLKALAVCAELTGTEFSEAAALAMTDDLSAYPHAQVLTALTRCRRELKGKLSIAAILERLDDGRPGANEAWAMIPQDESGSVVWTHEMAEAYGVSAPLLAQGQTIAARSAFIEFYDRAVAKARADLRPPAWTPSLGHDPRTREAALNEAVRKGRIGSDFASRLLPSPSRDQAISNVEMLTGPRSPIPPKIKAQLLNFTSVKK